jgi:hypothetical protein
MTPRKERILVLCKTYPSPSAAYAETSCVAGVTDSGNLLRLYPVPFRLIEDDLQFRKWQWIEALIRPSSNDRRPDSPRIFVDQINLGDVVPTDDQWIHRKKWLRRLPLFDDFGSLEASRSAAGRPTLALLHPSRVVGLDITPVADPEWTTDEKDKLLSLQRQGNLFEEADRDLRLLRKLPFDFHYRYECTSPNGVQFYRHKIVDWEVGALYWNVFRKHGSKWEPPFRAKIAEHLPAQDLHFLMGTIHRFPDQWLIVSLIYPPRQLPDAPDQGLLFEP